MENKPRVSLIAAISENRVIGKDNQLPWHIPSDLRRFREITSGHPVIMGRKTFESIGRLLPDRMNIIVTREQNYEVPGAKICYGTEEAIELASQHDQNEIFVIGGGEIFKALIKKADRLYLTIVKGESEGNVFFPDYSEFKKIISSEEKFDEGRKLTFLILERG